MIGLDEYVDMTQEAAIYKDEMDTLANETSPKDLAKILKILYTALGLAGEAGEVANKVKKVLRDRKGVLSEDSKKKLLGELGGVAWYLVALTEELGLKIEDVLEYNYNQILDRQARNTLKGDGDDR